MLQAICFKRHLDPSRHFLALRSPQGSERGAAAAAAAASLQSESLKQQQQHYGASDARLKKNDVYVPGRKDLIGTEVRTFSTALFFDLSHVFVALFAICEYL